MYLGLVCNAEIIVDDPMAPKGNRFIKLRLGQLMFLGIANYCKGIGKKHIYNHAADISLIPYYGRNMWLPGLKGCDQEEDISKGFPSDPSEMIGYVKGIEACGSYKPDINSGYRMKLCNYDFNVMFADLLKHTEDIVAANGGDLDSNLCNFS
jgi:hypothetical protein